MRQFLSGGLAVLTLLAGLETSAWAWISKEGDVNPFSSTWGTTTYATIGNTGSGTMMVYGDTVYSGTAELGASSSGTGTMVISDAGIWNNSNNLTIGKSGFGSLMLNNGGSVTDTYVYIGDQINSSGTVTVTGAGSTWNNSGELEIGLSGSGTLIISSGGSVSNTVSYIGYDAGATGTVEVTGSSSTWHTSEVVIGYEGSGSLTVKDSGTVIDDSSLTIGDYGTGSLMINSGGSVSNTAGYLGDESDSSGTATVTGTGSNWNNSGGLYVGNSGSGSLAISSGGSVTNTNGYIGYASDSSGTATVTGAGSTWNNLNDLYVGHLGSGSLTISSGGSVTNTIGYIGEETGSSGTVTVTGAGSTWNNSSDLYIGYSGTGNLTISNGGSVIDTTGRVGVSAGGTVTISGSSSSWNNSGDLWIGMSSNGNVTQDGGTVNVDGTLRLARDLHSSGTYNLNGGTLSVGSLTAGGGTCTFNFNGGVLQANNGFTTNVDLLTSGTDTIDTNGYDVAWNGDITGTGELVKTGNGTLTLNGLYTYAGGTFVQSGTLAVQSGFTSGSTSILKIGITPTSNGVLAVTGTASVAGSLEVVSGSGTYKAGTQYTFLTATGGISGTYSNVIDDLAFFDVVVGYDLADSYYFTLINSKNYVDEAHTSNQYDVAAYLDAHKSGATSDFADVLDVLNSQSGDGARAAFDAMSGEIYGSLVTISIENNERFLRTIANRMRMENMLRNTDFAAADACRDASLVYVSRQSTNFDDFPKRLSGWTTWFESYGVGAALAGNGNASGLGYSTGGAAVGMERYLDDCTLVGFGGGYASSRTTLDARSDWGSIDGGQCVAYLRRDRDSHYWTGIFAYGYNGYATKRSIDFGAIDRTADSNYGGNNYSTYFEVGRNLYGQYVNYQPFAALEYIGVRQNAFAERNADSIDLQVDPINANAFRSLLGTRVLNYYRTGTGRLLTLDVSAAWRHEFLNDNRILDASYVGQTGGAFFVSGVNVDRDAAIVGTGLSYALSHSCSLHGNYDLLFSKNYTVHGGVAGFQYAW